MDSYLIVGAGVFGVSTAYHLIRQNPDASVTLVDRDAFDADSRVAASWDWNKVVRADYDDIVYCQLALEAQDVFNSDPLWKPFFHETGIFWMCRSEYAQKVIDNFKKIGRKTDLCAIPVNEARKMYNGLFEDADYAGVKEVLVNRSSGWCAAGDCLQAVTRKVIQLGVRFIKADIATLLVGDDQRCHGVRTAAGETLKASQIVLCTGAYTPKLLEYSAQKSGIPHLRADDRILAGGITTGIAQLDDEMHKRFAAMPVGVQGYTAETGPFIGSLPPTTDKELKWWGQTIFTNTQQVLPNRYISAPPSASDYSQWNVPAELKKDIEYASQVFYGDRSSSWDFNKYRICWDAFTTSSDFIISPHAAAKGLYIATCGSFHGFKFFPVLGKYVVQMLEGSLAENLAEKWAWNRERPDPKLNPDWPRVEMGHVLQPSVARL